MVHVMRAIEIMSSTGFHQFLNNTHTYIGNSACVNQYEWYGKNQGSYIGVLEESRLSIHTCFESDTHAHCTPGRVAGRNDLNYNNSKQWENSL